MFLRLFNSNYDGLGVGHLGPRLWRPAYPPRRVWPSVRSCSASRALQRCPRRGATPPRTSLKVDRKVGGEGVGGRD